MPRARARRLDLAAWALAAIVLLGLGLRLRESLARGGAVPPRGDDSEYYSMGRSLRDDGILYDPRLKPWRPTAFREMLYPAFIALTSPRSWGPAGPRLAQAALGALGLLLVFGLGRRLHSAAAGLAAAGLLAVNAAQAQAAGSLYLEAFFSVLLCGAGLALVRWAEKPDARSSAVLGLALGLTLTCRSTLFALPVLLAAWAFAKGLPRAGRLAAVLLACAYLPSLPWTLRNARHFREFVPFERYTAGFPLTVAAHGVVEITGGDEQVYRLAGLEKDGPGNPDERERRLLGLAAGRIAREPWPYLSGVAKRLAVEAVWLGRLLGWWVLALAAAGAWLGRGRAGAQALTLAVAYVLLAHGLLAGQSRYLVPLVPWALSLAGLGAALLWERVRRPPAEPSWGPAVERAAGTGFAAAGAALYLACLLFIAHELRALAPGAGLLGPNGELKAAPGAFGHAVRALSREIDSSPPDARLYKDRGVAHFLDGRPAEAARDLERAARLDPGDPRLRESLAAARAAEERALARTRAR